MNSKKLLYILFSAMLSLSGFTQILSDSSPQFQQNLFEQNVLSLINSYNLKPCKILVYSRNNLSSNPQTADDFNQFLRLLEKCSNRQIKITFTESLSQFNSKNLQKFDCVVLNNVSAKALASGSFTDSLPVHLQNLENEKSKKYLSDLEFYLSSGGSIFILASDIPPVFDLHVKQPSFSSKTSYLPVLVSHNQFTSNLWSVHKRFLLQDNIEIPALSSNTNYEDVKSLLSTDVEYLSSGQTSFPLAWVKDYKKGKIFYCALSKGENKLQDSIDILSFYIRGIQYLIGNFSFDCKELNATLAPESAIVYLRNIKDEKSEIYKAVSQKIRAIISKNPKSKELISKLCVEEFDANLGTSLYKNFLVELLLQTSLRKNSNVLLSEIQRAIPNKNNQRYVESLIRIIGESKDENAAANLKKLLLDTTPEYALVATLRVISKIKNPKAVEITKNYSQKLLAEESTSKELKEQAVKSLLEIGTSVDLKFITKDSIGYLGNNKHLKIPANISFETLPFELHIPLINALTNRKEAYEKIISQQTKDSKEAYAITNTIVKFSKIEDVKMAFDFANLYDEKESEKVATLISSMSNNNKVECFWSLKSSLKGNPKKLLLNVLLKSDASKEIDFLFKVLSNNPSDEDRELLLALLKNAHDKSDEISSKAHLLFDKSQTLKDKATYLQLVALSQTEDSANLCLWAYANGLKNEAIFELSKWEKPAILSKLCELYKTSQTSEDKSLLESVMFEIMKNSFLYEHELCDYLSKNAVDKNIPEKIVKFRRGNLKNAKFQSVDFGINAASIASNEALKNTFDDNVESFLEINKDSAWITFEFSKGKTLSSIEMTISSTPESLKLYGGVEINDMSEFEYELKKISENKYRLRIKKSSEIKFLKLENLPIAKLFEISFLNDSSVYKKELDRVGNRCIASASNNSRGCECAFDGRFESSWSTNANREPKQWFFVGVDKVKEISSLELFVGENKNNRILKPKIYLGETIDEMSLVEIEYIEKPNSDFIKLKKPQNARFIIIENNDAKDGPWKISEIKVN